MAGHTRRRRVRLNRHLRFRLHLLSMASQHGGWSLFLQLPCSLGRFGVLACLLAASSVRFLYFFRFHNALNALGEIFGENFGTLLVLLLYLSRERRPIHYCIASWCSWCVSDLRKKSSSRFLVFPFPWGRSCAPAFPLCTATLVILDVLLCTTSLLFVGIKLYLFFAKQGS